MVGVQHGAGLGQVEPVLGGLAPGQVEHAIEPRPDPALLGALTAGALEAVELLVDGLADLHRQRQGVELGAVVVTGLVVAVAELLADGLELLAQEELPLLLLHAVGHAVADLAGDLQLGQVLARPGQHDRESLAHVDGLEHVDLVLGGRLAPGGDGVGEGAGLGDGPQDLGQAARAAQLGDVLQHGPQLADRLLDRRGADTLGDRLHVDPQAALLAGDRGTDATTLHAAQDRGAAAHRQVAHRLHRGDDADAGVATLVTGHEQHTLGVHPGGLDGEAGLVGVEREGDDGAGEDHAARHGDERESDPLLG